MTAHVSDGERIHRVMSAIADSIESASDEDLLEELSADGIDPAEWSDLVRGVVNAALETCQELDP